jgi:hypothetical protein
VSALSKAEQAAVQRAERYRGNAKDAITVGDSDRAGAYLQAASDWYAAAAKMIAVRKQTRPAKVAS